jgi:hypothetical protein
MEDNKHYTTYRLRRPLLRDSHQAKSLVMCDASVTSVMTGSFKTDRFNHPKIRRSCWLPLALCYCGPRTDAEDYYGFSN